MFESNSINWVYASQQNVNIVIRNNIMNIWHSLFRITSLLFESSRCSRVLEDVYSCGVATLEELDLSWRMKGFVQL